MDDGDLIGQLREDFDAPLHDIFDVDGPGQECLDRAAFGRGQRLDCRKPVDEQSVALVGRNPASTRMRLGDESLVLEGGHVMAHGRRRHAKIVALNKRT